MLDLARSVNKEYFTYSAPRTESISSSVMGLCCLHKGHGYGSLIISHKPLFLGKNRQEVIISNPEMRPHFKHS